MTMLRNMKVWVCLACMATSLAAPAPQPLPLALDIIDMAAISRMTPQQLEVLAEGLAAEEIMRTKRSSAGAISSVVSKAASGIQSKVGFLGQASAGAASFVASASGKSGHGETGYSYEPHSEKVDYWGLKKSILYTLFQAVKAITGGVTILKGQLIKGGGALAATLGKVISSKGDTVSNIGKKIVSSAALSHKPASTAVYGPPPTSHVEYAAPPSAYGAPTAPALYTHSAPAAPTGYGHKYPAHLDGRGKLSGVHAGVVFLAPLGDAAPSETQQASHGYTPLEPPPSILHTVYSAIKDAFSSAAPSTHEDITIQLPPPPIPHNQPVPEFKPMAWPAVNSYGEPAMPDTYPDFDPRNPHPPFDYASSKNSIVQPTHKHNHIHKHEGLTPAKIQKINNNLNKLAKYMNENQRSSEVLPQFNPQFSEMLKKGQLPLLGTPVVIDNEIGVLPGELLPDPLTTTSTTSSTTTSTTTTTTTEKPKNTTQTENTRRKKETRFILRGNKIVQV